MPFGSCSHQHSKSHFRKRKTSLKREPCFKYRLLIFGAFSVVIVSCSGLMESLVDWTQVGLCLVHLDHPEQSLQSESVLNHQLKVYRESVCFYFCTGLPHPSEALFLYSLLTPLGAHGIQRVIEKYRWLQLSDVPTNKCLLWQKQQTASESLSCVMFFSPVPPHPATLLKLPFRKQ